MSSRKFMPPAIVNASLSSDTNTALRDHEVRFSSIFEALHDPGKEMDRENIISQYLMSLSGEYQTYGQGLQMQDN